MSLILTACILWLSFSFYSSNTLSYLLPESLRAPFGEATSAKILSSPFIYYYGVAGILPEAGDMSETWSPYWWVNSGAYLIISDGKGSTVQSSLPSLDPWRLLYRSANPTDTDNGFHPQNIFRLVSRTTWSNVRVSSEYKIERDNFSSSPNRNASNGLLLMLRYRDQGDTLYYAGVRVDGTAIIKKKYKGTYYTMAQKQIFPGTYSRENNNNFLPHGAWLTLQSETVTNSDNSVSVRLYLKKPGDTNLVKILEAKDSGNWGGTPPIREAGYVGLRTDFMDVSFDTFKIERL